MVIVAIELVELRMMTSKSKVNSNSVINKRNNNERVPGRDNDNRDKGDVMTTQ